MCYIYSTLDYGMCGWVGDEIKEVNLHLYCDADFAGCSVTNLSTSGVFMGLEGSHTFFPIAAVSKKQSCVSNSTPEAEIAAAHFGLRTVGIPGIVMWYQVSVTTSAQQAKDASAHLRGGQTRDDPTASLRGKAAAARGTVDGNETANGKETETNKALASKGKKKIDENGKEVSYKTWHKRVRKQRARQIKMETRVETGVQLNGSILYMHDDNEAMIAVCRTGKKSNHETPW